MRGIVYLVGAGPGDIGLLTQKALEVIKEADVLVYDRLVNKEILEMAKEGAELIDAGKEPGQHKIPQDKINKILLKKAREGKKVVRLKGGDPFIFGRGGEEAIYLSENGINYEIVPGISSFVAVPSYAGIPLTHRGISSSFLVLSGHDLEIDWEKIASLKTTLIFLMSMSNLEQIAESLIKNGMAPDTPSAVIMEGTTQRQKKVFAPLGDIARLVKEKGIRNPAVFVVGKVVELGHKLLWYEKKRLFGKRILITRPKEQAFDMAKALREEGAEVLVIPTIKIINQKDNIREFLKIVEKFHYTVFTSSNAVLSFMEGVKNDRYDLRRFKTKVVAVGKKTAEALENFNIYPDLVPEKYTSEGLGEVLKKEVEGKSVAVLTSDIGGEILIERLKKYASMVEKVVAYLNVPNYEIKEKLKEEVEKGIDIAIFTSPSTFKYLELILEGEISFLEKAKIAAIGPVTKKAIEEKGFNVSIVPEVYTSEKLIEFILTTKEV
ncbi:hypothetical protein O163_13975 [Caldanaerobacter subterraneus subsp. yonseiensis KB-1]|uniref:uroporphyrinogen-III C-methyltransferase n=1 Tax=Caldanaerobacter subterraneus subsp. yonseiensis KB-1 TaxID=1388761 RepID=U5CLW9_CALSX|nr:uroporphyrinogen-III C-methyltransferase [Caldanaerobacter subterraneus]ERM90794.1 hypothetical protein O163_13975 [Caldanaerobacter subterraneus subsp. yonseiensis KB-1]